MGTNDKVVYTAPVVEFLAVAKEYCQFLAGVQQFTSEQFIDKLQKFIPLLYLKGAMLPSLDDSEIDGECEDFVTEDEYNALFLAVILIRGSYHCQKMVGISAECFPVFFHFIRKFTESST